MNSEKERRRRITALEMSDEFFFSSIESNRLKINRRLIKRLEKESSEQRSTKMSKKTSTNSCQTKYEDRQKKTSLEC